MRGRVRHGVAPRVLAALLACVGAAGCGPADGHTARVRVALAESSCADFCAARVGASLYRVGDPVPLGPERTVACGETLSFEGLPGNLEVVVEAWVEDDGGRRLLSGRSPGTSVEADQAVSVPVDLVPEVRPILRSASPSALLPVPSGSEVLLEGEGLGTGQGLAAVELDGVPVTVVKDSWRDGSVRILLRPGAGGTGVRVRNCGVASEALPLHVAADPPGTSSVQPLGCPAGARVHAASPLAGTADLLLALSCGDQGYLQRLRVADCAFSATVQRALPGLPRSLSVEDDGGAAWVVTDDGVLARVPLEGEGEPAVVVVPASRVPRAVAWVGGTAWALASAADGATSLLRVAGGTAQPFQDLPSDLDLRDLAAGPGVVLAAAVTPGGEGRLAVVVPDSGEVRLIPLDDCPDPVRVAGGPGGAWAAVACGGTQPVVVPVHLQDGAAAAVVLPGHRPLDSLAVDRGGTVALGWQAGTGGLVAVDLPAGLALEPWGPTASGASVLARSATLDTLLVAGDEGLMLLSPWSSAEPCGPGGPP